MLGWLRAATGAIASRFEGVRNRTISLIADWLTNTPWLLSSAFWTLATKAYGGNAVVYACVRLLSQSIPEAPMRCYQEEADGNRTLLDRDHPLCQLIAHPNELMTEYEFWELTTIHLAAAGQSFWWKERANSGQILALWPLRPDRISPLYSDSTKPGERVIFGWNYQDPSTGEFSPIPRRDVLSFNLPSPASERNRADSGGIVEGLGPLQVLAAEISADNEATSFVGALLKNYAAPTVALRVKAAVRSQEDADLLKSKFKAQFGGARRGDPALLDADTEIQMIGFNLEQLEFPDLRAVAESRIAAALGVPAILVGLKAGLDRSTFSNMAESRSYFAETTLANYWRRYSDQMANDLAPEFGEGIVCEFDTSNVRALAGQRIERVQPLKDGFGAGAVTRGEYRAALGLEARDGDDVYVIAATMIEVPAVMAGSPIAAKTLRRGQAATRALPPRDPRDEAERRLRAALVAMFEKTAPEVARKIAAGKAVSDDELATAFRSVFQPELARINADEQLRLGAEIGVQFDPAVVNAAAVEWSKTYSYELVKGITETTQKIIGSATEQFLATPGMTVGELTAALEQTGFGSVRAEMQAVTETSRAFSQATNQYQANLAQQGIKMVRMWRTAGDELVCPICGPLDSQSESEWSGEYGDGPPAHVNCRCGTSLQLAKGKAQ